MSTRRHFGTFRLLVRPHETAAAPGHPGPPPRAIDYTNRQRYRVVTWSSPASQIASTFRSRHGQLHNQELALDGEADHGAPLGPGAVVVLDLGVAQELLQREPGVAAALPDAAVGDHFLVRSDALALIQRLQLLWALEGAVRLV